MSFRKLDGSLHTKVHTECETGKGDVGSEKLFDHILRAYYVLGIPPKLSRVTQTPWSRRVHYTVDMTEQSLYKALVSTKRHLSGQVVHSLTARSVSDTAKDIVALKLTQQADYSCLASQVMSPYLLLSSQPSSGHLDIVVCIGEVNVAIFRQWCC